MWVSVKNFDGIYEINPDGMVKSLARYVSNPLHGQIFKKERILSRYLNISGRVCVMLSKEGVSKDYLLHRLLAEAFIPNPNNYPIVRHLNDNPLDNRLSNLAWGTMTDNTRDRERNGKYIPKRGSESHMFGKIGDKHPVFGRRGINSINYKLVLDTNNGVFYYGTEDAAKAKNIPLSTLRGKLSGHYKNNTSLIYV